MIDNGGLVMMMMIMVMMAMAVTVVMVMVMMMMTWREHRGMARGHGGNRETKFIKGSLLVYGGALETGYRYVQVEGSSSLQAH